MSKIHYFQRFTQKENVVTNNTLLLFSRLYSYSPIRFNEFINTLIGGQPELKVGLDIFQQRGSSKSGSVPDGLIFQESFGLVIETKLYKNYSQAQLASHLNTFRKDRTEVLLLLAPTPPTEAFLNKIQEEVKAHNSKCKTAVAFKSITFEQIIKSINEILSDNDFEMKAIVEDYEQFCDESSLLPVGQYTLRIVPCAQSLASNFKYDMYYAPATRSYRDADYLGIYKDKKVQGVGKLKKIVIVNNTLTKFEDVVGRVTAEDKSRIKEMMAFGQKEYGHFKTTDEHSFFIVDKFNETEFIKASRGGLWGQRYVDLRDYTSDHDALKNSAIVSNLINHKTW